jgi:hypothetical protein
VVYTTLGCSKGSALFFLFNIPLYIVYCNSFWAKRGRMGTAMGAILLTM